MMSSRGSVSPLATDQPATYASRQRQTMQDRLDDLLCTIESHEDLILNLVSPAIAEHVDQVLRRLSHYPGFAFFEDDAWPYTHPLREAEFLEQLFWAKHEYVFVYWNDSFRQVVSQECQRVIQAQEWGAAPTFDLLMAACVIEQGPTTIQEMETWAARQLSDMVWSELMDSDMSILYDRGIATSEPPVDVVSILGGWATATLDALAQKVIRRLSRIKAAGLFEEYRYTSVWGEYSHNVQTGDHEGFSDMLDDMVENACEAVVETVPRHEIQLFDRLAEACGEVDGMSGITYLVERLKDEVSSRASRRNLTRYADDIRWFEEPVMP
jgi:hypothetical protein